MPKLGLSTGLTRSGIVTPGIVTDSLVLKHNYAAGGVIPISDGAVSLNGTNAYINCGNGASLQIGDTDTTYTAWVKSNGGNSEYIISKRDGSNGAQSLYLSSAGKLLFLSGTNDSQAASNTALNDGLWHHVAVVYDQSEDDCFYYLDGVADGSDTSVVTSNHDDNSPVYIGYRESGGSGHYFDGYICNVGFFSAALTQPQIKSIMWKNYVGLIDSEKTNLVSWWDLDLNIGSTVPDYHGINHGTLV